MFSSSFALSNKIAFFSPDHRKQLNHLTNPKHATVKLTLSNLSAVLLQFKHSPFKKGSVDYFDPYHGNKVNNLVQLCYYQCRSY